MFKNKWNILFIVLTVVVFFSLFAVPKIAITSMDATKGQIIYVQP